MTVKEYREWLEERMKEALKFYENGYSAHYLEKEEFHKGVWELEIKVYPCCIKHIQNISCYNHNYYQLLDYGDWFQNTFEKELYLYEECHEDENCYTDSIGYFEKEIFVSLFSCTNTESAICE